MNTAARERFHQAFLEILKEEHPHLDVKTVVDISEDTRYSGGCETCAFEYTVIEISYKDSFGGYRMVTLEESFADLVSSF